MIRRLIDTCLRQRFLVLCAALLLALDGVKALRETPIDALPDLTESQVLVFADWPGRSPQEVEDQITFPLSVNLQGLAGVRSVRANSMFGFSLVTVVFEDPIDNYFARQRVSERLGLLASQLPAGVVPQLGPDATGLGWIYQYHLEVDPQLAPAGGYDLGTLRALQDFYLRYQLQAVPGVAEVASVGGFVRQYQVEVDPVRLQRSGLTLSRVSDAITANHLNVGGKVMEENGMEFIVRGVGLIKSVADLEGIAVAETNGVPIFLRDIATVQVGGDFRRGALDVAGHEAVGGIVVLRNRENARAVLASVKARLIQLAPSLPPGVSVRAFYDRGDLIDRTLGTLRRALVEEIVLVTLAHILFLFHFRSILIVTLPLPLSILFSFICMRWLGISSNIMSLTGIAVAIGVLVDAGIVMTENVIRQCEREEERLGRRLTAPETMNATRLAAHQVGRPIFFAMAIVVLAFVPVFALAGQEGKLFHPLAFTKTFACLGATVLAVTLVPVLASLLVRGPFHREEDNLWMRLLLTIYAPILNWALGHRRAVLALAGSLLALAAAIAFGLPGFIRKPLDQAGLQPVTRLFRGFGREFMPTLQEGSLLFMPVLLPSTSLTEVKRIMAWQDRVIAATPEVLTVAGKLGRAETATDPAPVEMIETTIQLRPESEWRPGMTREALVAELSDKLTTVPGYVPGFLQPIENRILMISTGIRAQVGIKLLGDHLEQLQPLALKAEAIVRTVPGAVGVAASRVQGKPYLNIEIDRPALARFGLDARSVMDVVEMGLGGRNVATLIDGRQRFPIQVRLDSSAREDIERLGEILVPRPSGGSVQLAQVAHIRRMEGPSEIASENGRLRVFVQANVQNRDLGGFVGEVKKRLDQELVPQLPPGVTVEFSGQYENQLHAERTLAWVVPVVILVIFLLLYVTYNSLAEAAHVLLAVPFALSGSVFLQAILGYPFSTAVWIGYIALFGIAIQTGIVMVVYLEEAIQHRMATCSAAGMAFTHDDLLAAIRAGARLRLRPKVMTVATTIASLLPIFWSHQAGSEVMRPLAAPVVGGCLSSLVHILIVTPVLVAWLRERALRRGLIR